MSHVKWAAGYFTVITAGKGHNTGDGTSHNTFSYTDTVGNSYYRDVDAAHNVITHDEQSGSLVTNNASDSPLAFTPNVNSQSVLLASLPGRRQLEIIV